MSWQGPSDPGPFGAPPPPPPGGTPPPPGGYGAPPPPTGDGAPGGYGHPAYYGHPGYGGPAYVGPAYGAPAPNPTNGLAIGALVCGILSLFCLFPLGFVGVGLGVAGLSKAKKINGSGKGLAIGGIVTGALGILATLAFVVLLIIGSNSDINSDTPDGVCNPDRILQDPDC